MDSRDKKYTAVWGFSIVGFLASLLLLQYGLASQADNYEDRMALYAENMSQPAFDASVLAEENMEDQMAEVNATLEKVE